MSLYIKDHKAGYNKNMNCLYIHGLVFGDARLLLVCDTDIYAISSSSKKVLGPIKSIVTLFKTTSINTFCERECSLYLTGYALLSGM